MLTFSYFRIIRTKRNIMKRNHLLILGALSISTLLVTSCDQTTDNNEKPKEGIDSLVINEIDLETNIPKVNIIDTLSFTLNATDKLILKAVENTVKPDSFLIPEDALLQSTEQLYKFYTEQETYWWETVASLEKDKLLSVDRLIQEMALNPKSSEKELKEVEKYSKKLKTVFLRREDISNQDKVVYDDINNALIDTIISIGNNIEDMSGYQTFNIMKDDILTLNNDVILQYRNAHARAITDRNNFILDNKKELENLGLNTTFSEEWAVPE